MKHFQQLTKLNHKTRNLAITAGVDGHVYGSSAVRISRHRSQPERSMAGNPHRRSFVVRIWQQTSHLHLGRGRLDLWHVAS